MKKKMIFTQMNAIFAATKTVESIELSLIMIFFHQNDDFDCNDICKILLDFLGFKQFYKFIFNFS